MEYEFCSVCHRILYYSDTRKYSRHQLHDGQEVGKICEDCLARYDLREGTCRFCGTPMYDKSKRPVCKECTQAWNKNDNDQLSPLIKVGGIFLLLIAIVGAFRFGGFGQSFWVLLGLACGGVAGFLASFWLFYVAAWQLPGIEHTDWLKFILDIIFSSLILGSIIFLITGSFEEAMKIAGENNIGLEELIFVILVLIGVIKFVKRLWEKIKR